MPREDATSVDDSIVNIRVMQLRHLSSVPAPSAVVGMACQVAESKEEMPGAGPRQWLCSCHHRCPGDSLVSKSLCIVE
jgi:hypothetical protein